MSCDESLANASAAASTSHGPDKRYAALSTGEEKATYGIHSFLDRPVSVSEAARAVKNGG